MKHIRISTLAALALAPAIAFAADPTKPAKSGQEATTKPAQETPARNEAAKSPAADPAREPGKSSDASAAPKAGANKFQGKITAVNKSARTITINDEKMGLHTLHVGNQLKGVTGAEAASWDQLTIGTEVKGACRKDGQAFHAESLSVVR